MSSSIRGGAILTQAGLYVLSRAQTVGAGDLNIPSEKIKETGNWDSVETIYDTAEITWDLESFDTSCQFECALIGEDSDTFSSTVGSNEIDLRDACPLDVTSPIKSRRNQYDIVAGSIAPYLTLSSATYRFGVGESSTQSFTMNGDSLFYQDSAPIYEEIDIDDGDGPYNLAYTADLFSDVGGDMYVLSAQVYDTTTGAYKRVFFDGEASLGSPSASDSGYSNSSTQIRLDQDYSADYDTLKVTYFSSAASIDYDPSGLNPNGEEIHRSSSVLPGAIRGKNIEIWLGSTDATPVFTKFRGVQNVEVTWSVTLENDEELGSDRYTGSEYDTPDVSGTIGVLPSTPQDLIAKLRTITGVADGEVVGPLVNVPIPMEIRILHPNTGARLKTFYVPDARFTVPGLQAQVDAKTEQNLTFASDTGVLLIYNGARV